jgi:hypothetical protein
MSTTHVKILGLGLALLGYSALIEAAAYVLAQRFDRLSARS